MQNILTERQEFDEKLLRISPQMDEFEGYAHAHGHRMAQIADAIGAFFSLASQDRFILQQAALVHDVGELTMNRHYIRSAQVLNIEERLDMERHPVIGEQETAKMGLPRGVQLLVRWHHEWWNGGGYPDGLIAEQIPIGARILRIADTYTSLTSDRPFRRAWTAVDVRKYLTEWAGIEFDPAIVKAMVTILDSRSARSES